MYDDDDDDDDDDNCSWFEEHKPTDRTRRHHIVECVMMSVCKFTYIYIYLFIYLCFSYLFGKTLSYLSFVDPNSERCGFSGGENMVDSI